ncbi:hypothetical protein RRG08_053295 [Elysia crispata]|uniref:Protein kinase domain-containing protein n=1 Tax=Elysia crispata TaxID=231223 RepID=A0AAE1DAL2_9GAST|nr:hypothetical protein RRG08_053295 [Elysia crispata]
MLVSSVDQEARTLPAHLGPASSTLRFYSSQDDSVGRSLGGNEEVSGQIPCCAILDLDLAQVYALIRFTTQASVYLAQMSSSVPSMRASHSASCRHTVGSTDSVSPEGETHTRPRPKLELEQASSYVGSTHGLAVPAEICSTSCSGVKTERTFTIEEKDLNLAAVACLQPALLAQPRPSGPAMSFSPVPGSGTLLRVEEVRQRLNQCGLQGEKVTRKTARKYVPPTATSSRTVADMARRLGSVGPEGKEHYAKGSCRGEGHINGAEERVVTGEIYRTFSIHTRNIHKRFNREASISEKDDSTDTVNLLSDSPGRKSPIVNKESHSHNIQVNHILSPIPLKIASAPIPHKHAINHISNPSPTPIASDNTPLIQVTHSKTQQSPTQKNETTATGQKTSNGVNNHIVETDKCSQTSNKKLGKSPKTDASPDKQSDENKPFGLKNINPFSMLKISPFNNKKTSTGSKEIEANSSKALSTKEPEQKHTQSQYKTTKSDSYNTKTSQDGGLSKSLSNGNVSGTNLSGHSTPLDKKICAHMKHALSGGRVNIQEIINSPKVPKKDVAGTKNNTKGSKDEKLKNSNSSADKAISSSAQLEKTLGNTQVNGILPHHNIPQLNNTKNNTQTNSNHLNITADHNRRSESSASPTCDKPKDKIMTKEDKANAGSAVAKENGIDVSSEPDKESKKPNGCVESMDCTGVVFYKAKCLLQDSGRMGSKEKVKVDESEPSFYEEAPFERRDVTVKSDRWVTDLYTVDSLLGKGKFGEVKKCQERKTGRQLAAKFIEVNGPQDRNDVLNELEIMKNLQHPRLLQLYDAFEIRDRFCLVMELVNGGELFERVINDDFILTEKACVMFTRQICDGVAFMHSQNILHLDMKVS